MLHCQLFVYDIPEEYTNIKEELIEVSDCYRMFIDERCNLYPNDRSHWITSDVFYKDFKAWFIEKFGDTRRPPHQISFNEQILALCQHAGVDIKKVSSY